MSQGDQFRKEQHISDHKELNDEKQLLTFATRESQTLPALVDVVFQTQVLKLTITGVGCLLKKKFF